MSFTKKVIFSPGYDKRQEKPNYGIHNMEILFVLSGPAGATTFRFYTGWFPDTVSKIGWASENFPKAPFVSWHSLVPLYEGHASDTDKCQWLGQKQCFADSTGISTKAEDALKRFVTEGEKPIWDLLEEFYNSKLRDSHTFEI